MAIKDFPFTVRHDVGDINYRFVYDDDYDHSQPNQEALRHNGLSPDTTVVYSVEVLSRPHPESWNQVSYYIDPKANESHPNIEMLQGLCYYDINIYGVGHPEGLAGRFGDWVARHWKRTVKAVSSSQPPQQFPEH